MNKTLILGGTFGDAVAVKLAKELNAELGSVYVRRFPDNEIYVRVESDVKDRDVVYVNSLCKSPNTALVETVLTVETLAELGASRIFLVIPYMAYARQDSRFLPGEAVSIRIVSKILDSLPINSLITVDMHLHRIRDIKELFKQVKAYNVTAMEELGNYVKANYSLKNPIVVGPDEEAEQWASTVAKVLDTDYIVLKKVRKGDEEVYVTSSKADLAGRDVVIADDIISTGGTIVKTIETLKKLGAEKFLVLCTHAIFSGTALSKIYTTGQVIDVVSTDSVPNPVAKVSVAKPVAKKLKELLG